MGYFLLDCYIYLVLETCFIVFIEWCAIFHRLKYYSVWVNYNTAICDGASNNRKCFRHIVGHLGKYPRLVVLYGFSPLNSVAVLVLLRFLKELN